MKISEGGNRILISGLCSQLDLSIHAQIAPQPMHCMSRLANKNIVKPISTSKIVNEINFPAPTVCIEYNKENPNLGDGLIVLTEKKRSTFSAPCVTSTVSSVDTCGPGNDNKIGRLNQHSAHQRQRVSRTDL